MLRKVVAWPGRWHVGGRVHWKDSAREGDVEEGSSEQNIFASKDGDEDRDLDMPVEEAEEDTEKLLLLALFIATVKTVS